MTRWSAARIDKAVGVLAARLPRRHFGVRVYALRESILNLCGKAQWHSPAPPRLVHIKLTRKAVV